MSEAATIAHGQRLLIVAAHPDDETLGAGGVISRYTARGEPVRVVCLAEGITARYTMEEIERGDAKDAIAERTANAYRALDILGVSSDEVFLNDRLCCRLDQVPQIDIVKAIEAHLRDFRPTLVMTHAASDTNIDHRMVHEAALTALRPYHFPDVQAVMAFEVPSSTDWNPEVPFPANVFIGIEATLEQKMAACAAYGGEMPVPPHPRSDEMVRALARVRGAQGGMNYAEGFQLIRRMVQ